MQTNLSSIDPRAVSSFVSFDSTLIHLLPIELLLKIFQQLSLREASSSNLTCRYWNVIVSGSPTAYSQCLKEVKDIEKFSCLPVRFSPWMPMPMHWGLHSKESSLQFFCTKGDVIAFYPPFCKQSSNFFSFTSPISFSSRDILLSQCGNTYFLTPQGQTRLRLDLPTDLQPLVSHELVSININDPTKNRKFSLLGDLSPSVDNLTKSQIEDCFPISEDKVALITSDGKISFWNLLDEVPTCYKELDIHSWTRVCKVGNYLIFDKKIVNVNNPSLLDHGFEFENVDFKIFESSFCTYSHNQKEIRCFTINEGVLEQKWDIKSSDLESKLDKTKGNVISFWIKDMNEQFILIQCVQAHDVFSSDDVQPSAFNMIIVNHNGEVIHSITEEVFDIEIENWSLYKYPTFAHLSSNVLIYKNPEEQAIKFLHIPTKKYIQKLDWTKFIYDWPLLNGECVIQDIRFSEGKLNLLLSSDHTPSSNKPGQARIIQFDPQHTYPSGLSGIFHNIYSTVKGIYYAFPSKNN